MNQSPTFPKEKNKQMDFPEAIKQLIAGQKITRLEWNNKQIYGIFRNGYLTIHRDDKFHKWIVNKGDMMEDDWIIV